MKKTIAAILCVIFALSVLAQVVPTFAFWRPGTPPTDDRKCNRFGPMTDNVICTPYGGNEPEYLAFKGQEIDLMDWALTAPQVAEMNSLDPNMQTYGRAFFVDRGMRAFEINNMRFPTDDVNFRKALAHCFDKANYVATQLGGFALALDSPLAWSDPGWFNPVCRNFYAYDLEAAATILKTNGYTDKNADGFVEGPGGETISVIFYVRADDPDRSAMGQLLASTVEVGLAATSLGAGIDVDLRLAPKSECFQKVMVEFDFGVYTGGWSFGRDPTTLYDLYLGENAQAYEYTANYPGYASPEFDTNARAFMTAPTIAVAKEKIFRMQELLINEDCVIIPVFTYASYNSALVGWQQLVNTEGVGLGNYQPVYTLLNAYKQGTDTLRWGFMNDIETTNVYHAEWVWDNQIIAGQYRALIDVNPYDITVDWDDIALSWDLGTWTNPDGEEASTLTFHLRQDMYWHDIPPKADRTTPNGQPLLPNGATHVPVTADDIAFSIISTRDIPDAWNKDLVADVSYVEILDPFTVKCYMGVSMPLWALHRVGGIYILPKHVWEKVVAEGTTRQFDTVAQQCLSGCGEWLFDYAGSTMHQYYKMTANKDWYAYHPVDLYGVIDKPVARNDPGSTVTATFYLKSRDSTRTIAAGTMDVTIVLKKPDGTTETVFSGKNPDLTYLTPVAIKTQSVEQAAVGKYEFKATISKDPLTGHEDLEGYTVNLWSTIREDLDLNFKVNILDISTAAKAFGANAGDLRWDPKADIDANFKVNILDISKIALKWNWPSA